jgi:hypothetical protein
MSSRQGSKVKIKIPKVRRNSGEVRAYNEPLARGRNLDHILLWGTALVLFGLVLAGGALMWKWGVRSNSGPAASAGVPDTGVEPGAVLNETRDHYIQGRMSEAGTQGRLALALELASPSQPPLQKDIRRLLSLVALQLKDYPSAMEQLRWLGSHQPSADDQANLRFCQAQIDRSMEKMALDQLQGAQELLLQGQQQRALAEARQAARALAGHNSNPRSLQAAHLIVANIALQQGNGRLALLELQEAKKLGSLGARHQSLLARLQAMEPAGKPAAAPVPSPQASQAMSRMQVEVVIPRLESASAYPQGRPGSRSLPPEKAVATVPAPPAPDQVADTVPRPKPGPKLELPRLQLPNEGARPGSLPSYQDRGGSNLPSYQDQSGRALPTYSNQSRPRDSLPGY